MEVTSLFRKNSKAGGMVQAVECLLCAKSLSLNLSTAKQKIGNNNNKRTL
jgi:hypothetical protein